MAKKKWIDEAGNEIPDNRISQVEKLAEKYSSQILNNSKKVESLLSELKLQIHEKSIEIFDSVMKDNKVDAESLAKRKGNFTWFNFDRSVRIEVNISERIVFDDVLIEACKEKLLSFINKNLTSSKQFIKDLVFDAFQTSKGKLDTKKIMYLLRYRSKINDPIYDEAMNLLEKSIRKPDKRVYYRVATKNEKGEYDYVQLNFSGMYGEA